LEIIWLSQIFCLLLQRDRETSYKRLPRFTPRLDSPSGELNNKIIMATRSCVIIKVRPEDIGKTFKFDTNKLPNGVKLDNWLYKDLDGKVWRDEGGEERSEPVELKEVYIGIYCHNDGYINGGVGDSLKAKFNDYETARNLVVGGFCSVIDDDIVRHYANRGREDQKWVYERWNNIKPIQGKTQKDVYNRIDCQHIYLFDEARGGWLHKEIGWSKSGFKKY